jgi:hypothetical protein
LQKKLKKDDIFQNFGKFRHILTFLMKLLLFMPNLFFSDLNQFKKITLLKKKKFGQNFGP